MIQFHQQPDSSAAPVAVGLLSGGLDSTLAAAVVRDLGFEVHGVYFAMPWGCCDKEAARLAARKLGVKFIILQLDERYLEMVRRPKFGYGAAMNPCIDCRVHMFSRAAKYREAVGAEFVFTGEVLGQRPMSQKRQSMAVIERESGLEGRLLRPLSAQLLDPTIPESEGLIDRDRLLKMSGRSRREQMDLAERLGITDYPNPAGGCLLTDKNFARRMKDTLHHGYRNFRETIALQWGRHFRVTDHHKIILGRDKEENAALRHYAHADDIIMELPDKLGPTAVIKGEAPSPEILATAAALIQNYSRRRDDTSAVAADCWPVKDPNNIQKVTARHITSDDIAAWII